MNRAPVYLTLATLGSIGLLLGAYGFQHLGGLLPCKMCLWQRWPHFVAIWVGFIILFTGERSLAWIGASAAATSGFIGAYHAGVEWKFWDGPTSCSGDGGGLSAMDGAALLSTDGPTTLIMCDEIVWQFMGLSMAGWNAVISFGLTALWIMSTRRA
jgi:disulfide bond formation protein DsbB